MRRNITFSARSEIIESARARARAEGRTLDEVFRAWLESYVDSEARASRYDELMASLSHVQPGRTFSRDETNQR